MSSSGRSQRHLPALDFAVHGYAVALPQAAAARRLLMTDRANSRASKTASVTSSGDQLRPAAAKHKIATRIVEGAARPAAQSRGLAACLRSSSSLAHMAHRKPLRRQPWSPCKAERGDRMGARRDLVTPGSSRNRGRHLLQERLEFRMMGEIIPERVGDIEPNPHAGPRFKFEQTNSTP